MAAVTTSIREWKKRLRAVCRKRRSALDQKQTTTGSRAIVERVCGLEEYLRARLVHTYVSSKENEVDTWGLIQRCLEEGRRIAVPVVQRNSRRLRHAEIESLDQLEPGFWGLYEPRPDHGVWVEDLDEIDLVVVPGVAFDPSGRRLGMGGGFYDRFLRRVKAPKVGLTYDCLLLDDLPVEEHDVPVEIVVTESAVYRALRSGAD